MKYRSIMKSRIPKFHHRFVTYSSYEIMPHQNEAEWRFAAEVNSPDQKAGHPERTWRGNASPLCSRFANLQSWIKLLRLFPLLLLLGNDNNFSCALWSGPEVMGCLFSICGLVSLPVQ